MGLIEKLKLLLKVRQPATDLITEVRGVKAGWKTLPFWITLVGTLVALAGGLQGILPVSASLVIITVLTTIYNILRGATKADVPGMKPVLQTTEFWMSVLAQISNAMVALKLGGIDPHWLATAETVVGVAMAAGQNLAGQQPTPTLDAQPTLPGITK